MAMDSYMNGVTKDYDKAAQPVQKADSVVKTAPKAAVAKGDSTAQDGTVTSQEFIDEILNKNASKEPARGTIDSAISDMNAKMSKTRCAYAYDEDTRRITIKVYDDETDELIREVPPEKSLEVLKKVWEIAGIIIDEKR